MGAVSCGRLVLVKEACSVRTPSARQPHRLAHAALRAGTQWLHNLYKSFSLSPGPGALVEGTEAYVGLAVTLELTWGQLEGWQGRGCAQERALCTEQDLETINSTVRCHQPIFQMGKLRLGFQGRQNQQQTALQHFGQW